MLLRRIFAVAFNLLWFDFVSVYLLQIIPFFRQVELRGAKRPEGPFTSIERIYLSSVIYGSRRNIIYQWDRYWFAHAAFALCQPIWPACSLA